MNKNVEEQLKGIIVKAAKKNINIDEITKDSNLISDFDYDSIQMVDLIVNIEKTFGIFIEDEDLNMDIFTTYSGLLETIMRKL